MSNVIDPEAVTGEFNNLLPPDYKATYDPDKGAIVKQNRFVRNIASVLRINPERIRVTNIVPGNRRRRLHELKPHVRERILATRRRLTSYCDEACRAAQLADMEIQFAIAENDPCESKACANGAGCDNGECICQDQWVGQLCDVNPCLNINTANNATIYVNNTCGDHGDCRAIVHNVTACSCHEGWAGHRCNATTIVELDEDSYVSNCTYNDWGVGSCLDEVDSTSFATGFPLGFRTDSAELCQRMCNEHEDCTAVSWRADSASGANCLPVLAAYSGLNEVNMDWACFKQNCTNTTSWIQHRAAVAAAHRCIADEIVLPAGAAAGVEMHCDGGMVDNGASCTAVKEDHDCDILTCSQGDWVDADGAPSNTPACVSSFDYTSCDRVAEALAAQANCSLSNGGGAGACVATQGCLYMPAVITTTGTMTDDSTLADGASAVNDFYTGWTLEATGAGAITTVVTGYDGPGRIVSPAVGGSDDTTAYILTPVGGVAASTCEDACSLVVAPTHETCVAVEGCDFTDRHGVLVSAVVLTEAEAALNELNGVATLMNEKASTGNLDTGYEVTSMAVELPKDECGIPGGDSSTCKDACGVAKGDNSTCADVCGVPNGGGDTCLDRCGVPLGADDCVDDCGVPNGDNGCLADGFNTTQCGTTDRQRLELWGSPAAVGDILLRFNGETSTSTLKLMPLLNVGGASIEPEQPTADDFAAVLGELSSIGEIEVACLLPGGACVKQMNSGLRVDLMVHFLAGVGRPRNFGRMPPITVDTSGIAAGQLDGARFSTLCPGALPENGAVYEEQVIELTQAVNGTFTLALDEQVTEPIAFDASAQALREALEALPSVGPGNLEVFMGSHPGGMHHGNWTHGVEQHGAAGASHEAFNGGGNWTVRFYVFEQYELLERGVEAPGDLPMLYVDATGITFEAGASTGAADCVRAPQASFGTPANCKRSLEARLGQPTCTAEGGAIEACPSASGCLFAAAAGDVASKCSDQCDVVDVGADPSGASCVGASAAALCVVTPEPQCGAEGANYDEETCLAQGRCAFTPANGEIAATCLLAATPACDAAAGGSRAACEGAGACDYTPAACKFRAAGCTDVDISLGQGKCTANNGCGYTPTAENTCVDYCAALVLGEGATAADCDPNHGCVFVAADGDAAARCERSQVAVDITANACADIDVSDVSPDTATCARSAAAVATALDCAAVDVSGGAAGGCTAANGCAYDATGAGSCSDACVAVSSPDSSNCAGGCTFSPGHICTDDVGCTYIAAYLSSCADFCVAVADPTAASCSFADGCRLVGPWDPLVHVVEAVKGSVPVGWVPVDPAVEEARKKAAADAEALLIELAAAAVAAQQPQYVAPIRICGDGKLAGKGESCDDGNQDSNDGCNADCTITVGWRCDYNFVGETSVCFQPATPVIGFTQTNEVVWNATEGDTVTIPVLRSNDNETVSRVSYRMYDGTATADLGGSGSDYETATGVLWFGYGNRTLELDVRTLVDDLYDGEGHETEVFQVQLFNPVDCELGSNTMAKIVIRDREGPPEVQFVAEHPQDSVIDLVEGETKTITVEKVGFLSATSYVYFRLWTDDDDDATAGASAERQHHAAVDHATGADFETTPAFVGSDNVGTLLFQPEVGSMTLDVTALVDNWDGPQNGVEHFSLELLEPFSAVRGVRTRIHFRITDTGTAPTIQFVTADSGLLAEGGSTQVQVQRLGDLAWTSTVEYASNDGTACSVDNGECDPNVDSLGFEPDFEAVAGTLTFAPFQEFASIRAKGLVDSWDGFGNEIENFTISINATSMSNADGAAADATLLRTVVRLRDAQPPPSFSIAMAADTIEEGEDNVVTVTRSGDLTWKSTVQYETVDGTATVADGDFTAMDGTLDFMPGVATRTLTFESAVDRSWDGAGHEAETASVRLAAPFMAVLGGAPSSPVQWPTATEASVTILDAPVFELVGGQDALVAEGHTVTLSLRRVGDIARESTVRIRSIDETALVSDGDYTAVDEVLTFAAGDAALVTTTVAVLHDQKYDGEGHERETFRLELSEPTGGLFGNTLVPGPDANFDQFATVQATTAVRLTIADRPTVSWVAGRTTSRTSRAPPSTSSSRARATSRRPPWCGSPPWMASWPRRPRPRMATTRPSTRP